MTDWRSTKSTNVDSPILIVRASFGGTQAEFAVEFSEPNLLGEPLVRWLVDSIWFPTLEFKLRKPKETLAISRP